MNGGVTTELELKKKRMQKEEAGMWKNLCIQGRRQERQSTVEAEIRDR